MDLTGEYRIPAPREAVWAALNDPEILKQCIPGCEEIVKLSDTEMTAKVTARVGPVKASFAGKVTLSDLDPPNGYRISGEGQGGVAGFAKGGADVRLRADEAGAGTVLAYTANASVGGKLAQIGSSAPPRRRPVRRQRRPRPRPRLPPPPPRAACRRSSGSAASSPSSSSCC
jgi:hypothetical protein